jgi:hypothetical protein
MTFIRKSKYGLQYSGAIHFRMFWLFTKLVALKVFSFEDLRANEMSWSHVD